MTYCDSKKVPKTFSSSKRKNAKQFKYEADHIPASGYMIEKAARLIEDGDYVEYGVEEINDCMKIAIQCQALTVMVPQQIHKLGYSNGLTLKQLDDRGDFNLSPTEMANKEIDVYKKVLTSKQKDAVNKKSQKVTARTPQGKKDRDKLKSSNKKCNDDIKEGLDKAVKEQDPDKFLDDMIKENKECSSDKEFKKHQCNAEDCKK